MGNYEYKYITVNLKGIFEGKPEKDYHEIIDEHAKRGWKLVQVFAPPISGKGFATFYEIILERPIVDL